MPFANAEDVYSTLGEIFQRAVEDPRVGPAAQSSGAVLQLRYASPDSVITCDFPGRKVHFGDGSEVPTPNVVLESAAAAGNKYWLGKLNHTMALAKREVRSKGQVSKILKLVPLTKPLFASYTEILREMGRKDLLEEAGVK